MSDDKFDKDIDLHESEWHHEKKREPILGPNGKEFIFMAIASVPAYFIAKFLAGLILG